MPNTDDFRALKMEFIDCDVSQFSTSRPTLTHTQPNPSFLRIRKTWDEYCHKVQRYNASDSQNQPQSALSASIETSHGLPTVPYALSASSSSDLEATIRKILAEPSQQAPHDENTASKRSMPDPECSRSEPTSQTHLVRQADRGSKTVRPHCGVNCPRRYQRPQPHRLFPRCGRQHH